MKTRIAYGLIVVLMGSITHGAVIPFSGTGTLSSPGDSGDASPNPPGTYSTTVTSTVQGFQISYTLTVDLPSGDTDPVHADARGFGDSGGTQDSLQNATETLEFTIGSVTATGELHGYRVSSNNIAVSFDSFDLVNNGNNPPRVGWDIAGDGETLYTSSGSTSGASETVDVSGEGSASSVLSVRADNNWCWINNIQTSFSGNVTTELIPGKTVISQSGWTDVLPAAASTGDYYGTIVTVGAGESGTNASGAFSGDGSHTNGDGDDSIGWAVGDYVLEGDFPVALPPPTPGDILAKIDLTIPAGATDIDLSLSFNLDMEGTLEANDSLRIEIYDVTNDVLLNSTTLADEAGFPIGDIFTSLVSNDHAGLTDVQARIVYVSGFDEGDQEEIQIGNPLFSAAYVAIPEPCTLFMTALLAAGLFRRRRGSL